MQPCRAVNGENATCRVWYNYHCLLACHFPGHKAVSGATCALRGIWLKGRVALVFTTTNGQCFHGNYLRDLIHFGKHFVSPHASPGSVLGPGDSLETPFPWGHTAEGGDSFTFDPPVPRRVRSWNERMH